MVFPSGWYGIMRAKNSGYKKWKTVASVYLQDAESEHGGDSGESE